MKTRKFNQYYFGVIRGAAVVAGVVLLVTQVAYSASTDATPKWIFHADTALPASDAHSATQLAQDDGSAAGAMATGTAADEPTAADDAAVVFSPRDCVKTTVGGCVQHAGGSGNGAASAGDNGAGASGNGSGGAAGSGSGGGKGNGNGSSSGGSSGGGSSGGGSSGGGSSGGGSSGGGSSGG
ncbi:hypothetical protein PQR58_21280, partial [Paraburkholderia sediminicola]